MRLDDRIGRSPQARSRRGQEYRRHLAGRLASVPLPDDPRRRLHGQPLDAAAGHSRSGRITPAATRAQGAHRPETRAGHYFKHLGDEHRIDSVEQTAHREGPGISLTSAGRAVPACCASDFSGVTTRRRAVAHAERVPRAIEGQECGSRRRAVRGPADPPAVIGVAPRTGGEVGPGARWPHRIQAEEEMRE